MRALPVSLSLSFSLFAAVARSQTVAPDPVEAQLRRGVELRRTGQDEAAFAEYDAAYAARPEPRTAAQLALACQATGRWLRAEALLRDALAAPTDVWITRNRAALDGALAVVERHLATVEVVGDFPGASVRVNGEEVGRLPLSRSVRVVAGTVSVEVGADGYEPLVRRFVTSPGETLRERVALVRLAPPALRAPEPTLPAVIPATNPPADAPRANVVTVDRGPWRALAVGAFAGAGVFVAAGVTALVLRESAASDYNTSCDSGDARGDCGSLRNREAVTGVIGWVALPVGALLAATGVYLALRARATSHAAARLSCAVGVAEARCAWTF